MSVQTIQPLSPDLVLPWTPNEKQEQFFKQSLKAFSIILLFLFILVPYLPVFEPELDIPLKKMVKTKVVLASDKLPLKKVKPKIKKVVEPVKVKQSKPKKMVKKSKKKSGASKANMKSRSAKNSRSSGLANFSSQLTALRGNLNVAGMKKKKSVKQGRGLVATVDRNVLGENRAAKATMGIDVDENIMKNASVKLSSHQTSYVEGFVSEGSLTGDDAPGTYIAGQRNKEAIKRTIDQKKGMIYALYYNALNDYSELHGNFVFKFDILPNGSVVNLTLVSSELGIAELEKQMLNRIKQFRFGAKDVSKTPVVFRFNFIPS